MWILIIDDDKDILRSLKRSLAPGGYQCFTFHEPEPAIESYRKERYDAVLTDFKMPSMSGIEVLKALKRIDEDAKVIIMTGYGDEATALEAMNLGAYGFYLKPLNIADLIAKLNRLEIESRIEKLKSEEYDLLKKEFKELKIAYEALKKITFCF